MKHYPPRQHAHHARVPAFLPVVTRARKDGWTARRQAAFLAALAITGSVREAARRVSMARESAYRLRRREGAESFAAAWDAIVGVYGEARRKVSPEERARRAIEGLIKPVIYRERHVANQRKPDNSALLRYLDQLDRGQGSALREAERSQGFAHRSASHSPIPPLLGEVPRKGGGAPLRQRCVLPPPPKGEDLQPTGTPPDTPDRTRTGALSPAYKDAARSGGIRR